MINGHKKLKCLWLPTTKIWKVMQNVKILVFATLWGLRGNAQSSSMGMGRKNSRWRSAAILKNPKSRYQQRSDRLPRNLEWWRNSTLMMRRSTVKKFVISTVQHLHMQCSLHYNTLRNIAHRQQCCEQRTIYPPTSTCAKCRNSTRSWSITSRPRPHCVEETTLAACHSQDTIQVSTDDIPGVQSPVPWLHE